MTSDTAHRPWPLPERPWSNAQSWIDLAFLHWPVEPDTLRPLVGASVELDTFEGRAFVGVVPFTVTDLRVRGLPPVPGLSTYLELNVRTYVTRDEKPGIWFFSLDATSPVVVEAARRLYRLPYERARMSSGRHAERVRFESARPGAAFSGAYRATGDVFNADPGTLEHFLTERYCLYTEDGSRAYRAEIHHPPWQLRRGEATVDLNTISPLPLGDGDPYVLCSGLQDAVVWSLEEIQT